MSKHTPGPWIVDDSGNSLAIIQEDDPTQWIATLYQSSAGQVANAAFIVQACNNFESLLAALKAAVACGLVPSSSAEDGGANKYSEQIAVADQIRAAIKSATTPPTGRDNGGE